MDEPTPRSVSTVKPGATVVPALTPQQSDIVLNVRGVVASYAIYWHKLSIDATIFITTACIALAGFAVTRDTQSLRIALALLAIICLLSWVGVAICVLIRRRTEDHQRILVQLDTINGLFEVGAFGTPDSIYPREWLQTGSSKWSDPVFRFTTLLLLFLPLPLGAIILIANGI